MSPSLTPTRIRTSSFEGYYDAARGEAFAFCSATGECAYGVGAELAFTLREKEGGKMKFIRN